MVSRPLSWTRNPGCCGQPDVNLPVPIQGASLSPIRWGGQVMVAESFDIRVLNTSGIEDHHAHLLRLDYLDRCLFFSSGNDDRAVDAHCLRLLAAQAIIIGAYDDG